MRTKNLKNALHAADTLPDIQDNEILLSRADVAKMFKVTTQTIIRLENDGKLQAYRLGPGTVRYRLVDVMKYTASCLSPVTDAVAV